MNYDVFTKSTDGRKLFGNLWLKMKFYDTIHRLKEIKAGYYIWQTSREYCEAIERMQ